MIPLIRNSLSTLQMSLVSRRSVERTTADLQRTSQEVSTGRKADLYADMGSKSAFVLALEDRASSNSHFITSNKLLGSKLEMISSGAASARGAAQDVLGLALANLEHSSSTASTLQQQARAALDTIMTSLNISLDGDHLFSGVASDRPALRGYDSVNSATGLSPQDVISGIVGSGPADGTQATSMLAQIDSVFDETNADPAKRFSTTFFQGDTPSTPAPRKTALIGDGETLQYGMQADDPEFRSIIKGLTLLASVDVSKIQDQNAYKSWMAAGVGALSDGVEGLRNSETALGAKQKRLDVKLTQQQSMDAVLNSRLSDYVSVDPYEAATRMTALQTQLNASYSVAAQMSKLSILNYL
ncbi:flagellin [Thioclava atlantica]|uniref:Flagellin n=1 Tax=Thioclava atlantica TaxID=1317124 RepID=A0A085TY98_9RHOB|nr:flagellin [Thioclava atlantica]KFE35695.1 flagellar hook-associated protein FlgL [Thioclava atlantica]